MARDPFVESYREALDATGLPWEVVNGSKHKKVYLGGRLVIVLPNARKSVTPSREMYKRTLKNIKQAAEQTKR
jgi:hypothetical protein